jgi:hypothetical protein
MKSLAAMLMIFTFSCATVVPMQTASVVDAKHLRVGGQIGISGFCGNPASGVGGLSSCSEFPDGIPLPELRVNGRYGLGHAADVGASFQLYGQLISPEHPFQTGLTLDIKKEIVRFGPSHMQHIISFGLLGGFALSGRLGLPLWAQIETGIPVFYGIQFKELEVVLGGSFSSRYSIPKIGATPVVLKPNASTHLGATLGLFHRPSSWGIQLGYLVTPTFRSPGTIQLQIGWNLEKVIE